ncbi:MAG TPA: type II secretion system protein GspD [Porticoccaceae bacterium]|nr:type II secretion system protein GspD [Porticoccaceae bacterium]
MMQTVIRTFSPRPALTAGIASILLTLGGCNTAPQTAGTAPGSVTTPAEREQSVQTRVLDNAVSGPILVRPEAEAQSGQEIYIGSGNLIDTRRGAPRADAEEGEVSLNFQATAISEVVKTILGDILGVNYSFDDNIMGSVSMRTARPVKRDALIPILENLLKIQGAALIKGDNYYDVVMAGEGIPSGLRPTTRLQSDQGSQLLITPLRYIGAREMGRILDTVKSPQSAIIVDEYRNILMLAGSHGDLANLRKTISIFDIDQMDGKSVGLFRLENSEASVLAEELESIFGDDTEGPLAGVVRFTVIERLNALLVVTPQKKYLKDAELWIKRLDHTQTLHGANMYVYYVQNGKADILAETLTQLFDNKRKTALRRSVRDDAPARSTPIAPVGAETSGETTSPRRSSRGSNQKISALEVGDVTIIADTENNALLILAGAADYEEIEKAIKKLDVLPMQVLVEASIVEVTLDEEIEYGLQWFFKDSHGKFNGVGGLNIPSDGDVSGALNGVFSPADFTYAVFDAAGTRAVLNAVAGDSRLDVLSSPSLMVLDNQTATIRVGDQVPVRTSESTNTNSDNFNVTSQIQYRDTGVTLEVTPRVNSGGMVILDLTQRVDDVDETDTSGIDSPTIIQREITTSVAVQSGETIVLGGLIRENRQRSDRGIPFLKDLPAIGAVFGGKRRAGDKTELVVMITPTAIANSEEARNVTEEYRLKLQDVDLTSFR